VAQKGYTFVAQMSCHISGKMAQMSIAHTYVYMWIYV